MKTKLLFTLFITCLIAASLNAQTSKWTQSTFIDGTQGVSLKNLNAEYYSVFNLDINGIKQQLADAPLRTQSGGQSNTTITFPDEYAKKHQYLIVEAPVLADNIAALHPNIKTYLGSRTDNSGTRIRFSVTPLGLNAMISIPGKETVYIQPVTKVSNGQYLVYNRNSRMNTEKTFECLTDDLNSKNAVTASTSRDANDQLLRTFRIAISVNGEYTQFWDDGNAANGNAQADALAQVVSTLNRTNEVFEVDMAITFTLVNGVDYNGNTLIFASAFSDPYTGSFNSQLQTLLTSDVGEANYDIGHLFAYGTNNGSAGCIGCVCSSGKGSGFSSHGFLDNNGGPYMSDFFDIDFVPHEIGHQMGGNHTFSNSVEGAGVNSEPGSGTTIMGYAGITGGNDVQDHSDPYFHYHTINQILNNVATSPNNCAVTTAISNNPPVAKAGADFAIPNGTAFILKATATDSDIADVLTYTWEQIDNGQTTNGQFGPTHTGPVWRSRPPSTSKDRYMPIYSRVLAGELTEDNPVETLDNSSWETVSTIARTLNFGLTVRDRSEANGVGQTPQSDFDTMVVNVQGGVPFTIVTPPAWGSGSAQTVSWNVGATNSAPINCQTVNIKFSTDGGVTFPTTLASATANDGSELINVPTLPDSNNARILIEAADNIFYALSNVFPISSAASFAINNSSGTQSACNIDSAAFTINFYTVNGFNETTTFSAAGNPTGSTVTFSNATLNADGATQMNITGLTGATPANYTITVTGTSASETKTVDVVLTVIDGICTSVANTTYATATTLVQFENINNASTKPSGYSDYTSISTDVTRGTSYPLTVHQDTDGNYTCTTTVWIDWNQNCVLESTEAYDLGTAVNTADGPTTNSGLMVAVPVDAVLGNTTMRVTTKYLNDGNPTACENGHDAEVEDYTVNVLTQLSVDEFGANTAFNIYPNPNNGTFNVMLNNSSNNKIEISVYDIRGRQVFAKRFHSNPNFNETIKLDNVQSGMYMLQVSNGVNTQTKKIIVN